MNESTERHQQRLQEILRRRQQGRNSFSNAMPRRDRPFETASTRERPEDSIRERLEQPQQFFHHVFPPPRPTNRNHDFFSMAGSRGVGGYMFDGTSLNLADFQKFVPLELGRHPIQTKRPKNQSDAFPYENIFDSEQQREALRNSFDMIVNHTSTYDSRYPFHTAFRLKTTSFPSYHEHFLAPLRELFQKWSISVVAENNFKWYLQDFAQQESDNLRHIVRMLTFERKNVLYPTLIQLSTPINIDTFEEHLEIFSFAIHGKDLFSSVQRVLLEVSKNRFVDNEESLYYSCYRFDLHLLENLENSRRNNDFWTSRQNYIDVRLFRFLPIFNKSLNGTEPLISQILICLPPFYLEKHLPFTPTAGPQSSI